MEKYGYSEPLCVGLGGGIATPESAAAAFSMGAAYVLTGSVNQSCTEAGICEDVRKLLCQAEQADVAMAPSADMFEIGGPGPGPQAGNPFSASGPKNCTIFINPLPVLKTWIPRPERKFRKNSSKPILKVPGPLPGSSSSPGAIPKRWSGQTRTPGIKWPLVFRSYLGQSSRWAIQGEPTPKNGLPGLVRTFHGGFQPMGKGKFSGGS